MATVAALLRTRADVRTIGLRITFLGALAQLAGIAVDAWLHADDPTLAEREGIFTLTNVGHALLVAGISLVIVGATLAVLARSLQDRPVARVALPLAMVAVLGGGTAFAANSSLARGHGDHEPTAAATATGAGAGDAPAHGDGHGHAAAAAEPDVAIPGLLDHTHEEPPNQPLDAATRDALAAQLVQAREVALRFPTVTAAEAAGYRMIAPYVPGIAAHYMHFGNVDGAFDIERPEMLLFDGTSPSSEIVGLSYYVLADRAPEGFVGPNDHWHRHLGLCISRTRTLVIGGEQTTAEECERRGGFKASGTNGWMNHVWVVPGWESPRGVFSAENPDLR